MGSEILGPVGSMLENRESLRNFAEREDKRVGANADEMYTGFIDGERHFVKSDLSEIERAAHIAAAPLMDQFDHSPDISYDPQSGEVAVSKLGDNPRSPNSARFSDSLYSNLAPVDEEAFYEVAAERWVLGDSNVYDNILVESVRPGDLMPGEERDVYLHDFDHAGKSSSKGRRRCFREAFEYVGEKLGIDFSMKRFQDEIGQLSQELDVERYRDEIEDMEENLGDELYQTVKQHGEVIANNIEYGREAYSQ
jgi:hypothetical protein